MGNLPNHAGLYMNWCTVCTIDTDISHSLEMTLALVPQCPDFRFYAVLLVENRHKCPAST